VSYLREEVLLLRKNSHPLLFLAGTALMAAAVVYGSDIVTTLPADSMVTANHLKLPRVRLAEAENLLTGATTPDVSSTPHADCSHGSVAGCAPVPSRH
jgi:hypothetical protein